MFCGPGNNILCQAGTIQIINFYALWNKINQHFSHLPSPVSRLPSPVSNLPSLFSFLPAPVFFLPSYFCLLSPTFRLLPSALSLLLCPFSLLLSPFFFLLSQLYERQGKLFCRSPDRLFQNHIRWLAAETKKSKKSRRLDKTISTILKPLKWVLAPLVSVSH